MVLIFHSINRIFFCSFYVSIAATYNQMQLTTNSWYFPSVVNAVLDSILLICHKAFARQLHMLLSFFSALVALKSAWFVTRLNYQMANAYRVILFLPWLLIVDLIPKGLQLHTFTQIYATNTLPYTYTYTYTYTIGMETSYTICTANHTKSSLSLKFHDRNGNIHIKAKGYNHKCNLRC